MDREDRNTWRHNNVLHELSISIQREVREVNATPLPVKCPRINFIPAGSAPRKTSSTVIKDLGVLKDARDWICDFDLPDLHTSNPYCFPP